MLWATGLQLSQDRSGYLVQHANKTAAASPTAKHWLSACCLLLLLRPALLPLHSHARRRAFAFSLLLFFSFFFKRCHLFSPSPSETDVCLRGESHPAPGHYLWSVRELSGLRRTEERTSGDKFWRISSTNFVLDE